MRALNFGLPRCARNDRGPRAGLPEVFRLGNGLARCPYELLRDLVHEPKADTRAAKEYHFVLCEAEIGALQRSVEINAACLCSSF